MWKQVGGGITILRGKLCRGEGGVVVCERVLQYSGRKPLIGKKKDILCCKWFQVSRPPYLLEHVALSHKVKRNKPYYALNQPYTTASYLELGVSNYIFGGFVKKDEIEMS